VGAAGVCESAGKRENASKPSQSVKVRFMFFSLGAAGTKLPAGSENFATENRLP
jgi:hypothetical protein